MTYPYVWTWSTRLPERRGQFFRVICRGAMNSAMIQFEDGAWYVTSRNAIRKRRI